MKAIIALLILALALTGDYYYKFSDTTKAATTTTSSWTLSYYNSDCTISTGGGTMRTSMCISNAVGFATSDDQTSTCVNGTSTVNVNCSASLASGTAVGFTIKLSCGTNPGASINATASCLSNSVSTAFPIQTVALKSGAGYMSALMALLLVLWM